MAKPVFKERKPINSSLKNELWDWLDEYAKATMIPKSKLLDKAIELLKKEAEEIHSGKE